MTAPDPSSPRHALLKFQIGPVQEFIAQARSTRDLWAGSWLLSHLTRKGVEAAESQGAKIARNFLIHPFGSLPAEGPGSEGVWPTQLHGHERRETDPGIDLAAAPV